MRQAALVLQTATLSNCGEALKPRAVPPPDRDPTETQVDPNQPEADGVMAIVW